MITVSCNVSSVGRSMPGADSRQRGQQYESLAKHYLQSQGLHFVAQNFTCRSGEIDLIFRDATTLVFVEVKYRTHRHYGHAAEMVTIAKQKKLQKTAYLWLQKNRYTPEGTDFRFDVIAIHDHGRDINWIKNAITQE